MTKPNLQKPIDGTNFKLINSDEFNGTKLDYNRWRHEKIDADSHGNMSQASIHATGSYGITETGEVKKGAFPKGKRWGAWMNGHLDKTLYLKDGALHMTGYVSNEDDPTCANRQFHPYYDGFEGKQADCRKKVYTSWIDTFALTWSPDGMIPDPAEPQFSFRYGYVECKIDFSQMKTPGFRHSMWLMPAVDPDNPNRALKDVTYSGDASTGVEIDVWEFEPASRNARQKLLLKSIGGGSPTQSTTDMSKFGLDMMTGWHTIGVHWSKEFIKWYVDGILVQEEYGNSPEVAQYMMLTREINTGIGTKEDKPAAVRPYRNNDQGLFASNAFCHLDKINSDVVKVDYIRVWQDQNYVGNWVSDDNPGVDKTTASEPKTTTPVVTKDTNVSGDGQGYFRWDGKTLSWPNDPDLPKYNIDIQNSEGQNTYHTTVETNSFVPIVSGKYSIYGVTAGDRLLYNQRSVYIDIDVADVKQPIDYDNTPEHILDPMTPVSLVDAIVDLSKKLKSALTK